MYTVTFYSFKGGVGRTMSLVNVATQLARGGKKVLIVDFDLEAPGIPTFSLTSPRSQTKGLVEYVVQYRATGESPDVRDYVYSAHNFESGGELLVMPAGLHDGSYSSRLNSIDWHKLYSKENGYLLFEDLKRQWIDSFAPDYVFIDSRTGHSDVEGICTRQLPDAVCLLFFPNEQNLQGLKKVVAGIRSQNNIRKSSQKPSIAIHFVVSNVPDLDDEDKIVGSILQKFKKDLDFKDLSGEIHHYNSLSLLQQEIFSESRPNSRLAREYGLLKDAIVRENIYDKSVAVQFLKQAVQELRSLEGRGKAVSIVERVEKILKLFPADMAIVQEVALIYEAVGRTSDALSLLSIEGVSKSADALALSARLNYLLGNEAEASENLRKMLTASGAQATSLLEALSVARRINPGLFDVLPNSTALNSLSPQERLFVASQIGGGESELRAKVEILKSLHGIDAPQAKQAKREIAYVYISLGNFDGAQSILAEVGDPINSIVDAFNLGVAKWGMTGHPDLELFGRVLKLHQGSSDRLDSPNYLACIAIANAIVGNIDIARSVIRRCRELMNMLPRRELSPWTYTRVSSKEFLGHLSVLEKQMISGNIRPAVFDRDRVVG